VTGPIFVGDDLDSPAQPLPETPLLFVVYWFDSRELLVADRKAIGDTISIRRWIAAPEVYLDDERVPASWSGWCYPLLPGPHEIEVRSPRPARLTFTVTSLANVTLIYRAELRFHGDSPGGPDGEATLIES
jgi:hypothetical protein